MADESIVIEIKDSIAPAISSKLKDIAAQARDSNKALNELQRGLSGLSASSVKTLTDAANAAANSLAKLATANQTLAASQARVVAQTTQSATTTNAAATAINKGAAATTAATAANTKYVMSERARAAAMRGVPAQITDIVVSLQGGQRPLTVLLQQGGQLKDMFGGIVPAARALGSSLAAMVNPVTVLAAAFVGMGVYVGMVENQMRVINGLAAQFAVTGRNFTGSDIQQLRKELELLPDVGKKAATEIITAFAQVRSVGGENLKTATKLTADLATAMGTDAPTAAQKLAKALDDPLKGAIALDKELGFLTVQNFKTIDSLMKAGKTAEAQSLLVDLLSKSINGLANDAMTPMQKATTDLGNAWNKFTGELSNTGFAKSLTDALIGIINALTTLINKLNDIASWKAPEWLSKAYDIGSGAVNRAANPVGALIGGMFGGSKTPTTAITGNNTLTARSGKQYTQTTEQKTDAAGITHKKSDKSAESRAAALAKINLQLDNQYKLMQMIGPERDKQEQFDRINETLTGRRITLTKEETASIKEKIAAIVDGAAKQVEYLRIYEDYASPLRTYNALQQAANELESQGLITLEQRNRELVKGFETYANIVDPLRQYNIALDQEIELSKTLGDQTQVASKIQSLENDLLTNGITIREDERKAIETRIKLSMDLQRAQAAENAILDQTVNSRRAFTDQLNALNKLSASGAITPGDKATSVNDMLKNMGIDTTTLQVGVDSTVEIYKGMYAKINEMRQANLLSEQDAASANMQIWAQQESHRFDTASTFFTSLEGLQKSSNKKLATIGRAAAISNAIVDTYKSATGAYAAMSSIPYVGPALGAAAAAAAIAAGMANVQAIRSQSTGYMAGGYTGNLPTNKEAGVVHGQEFVMNASSTAAHGVDNLQALQDGSASIVANSKSQGTGGGSGGSAGGSRAVASPNVNVPLRIVNVMDPKMIEDYMATPEGEQVFVNMMRRNRDSLNASANV